MAQAAATERLPRAISSTARDVGDDVGARALGLRVAHGEKTDLSGAAKELRGEARLLVELAGQGPDLALGELAEGVADGALGFAELEVHFVTPATEPSRP